MINVVPGNNSLVTPPLSLNAANVMKIKRVLLVDVLAKTRTMLLMTHLVVINAKPFAML